MDAMFFTLAALVLLIPLSRALQAQIDLEKTTSQRHLDYGPDVAVGRTLEFLCVALGTEPITYTWTKNGKILTGSEDLRIKVEQGKVQISKLNHTLDNGKYQCTARNAEGMDVSPLLNLQVTVLGSFVEGYRDSSPEKHVNATIGKPLELPCPATTYFYPKVFDWGFKQTGPANSISVNGRRSILKSGALYFSYVEESDVKEINDQGGIRCIIYSGGQEVVSCPFKLNKIEGVPENFGPTLIQKAENVTGVEGSYIDLACIASGRPTPTVKWFKDGVEVKDRPYVLQESGFKLSVKPLSKNNEGKYKCVASSMYDQKNHEVVSEAFVFVEVKPRWKKPFMNATLAEGSLFTANCSAEGDPVPTYKWYKSGKELGNGNNLELNGGLLIVRSVSQEDSGIYQCSASNKLGSIYSSLLLTVTRPPSPQPITTVPSTDKDFNQSSTSFPATTSKIQSSPMPSTQERPSPSQSSAGKGNDDNGSSTVHVSTISFATCLLGLLVFTIVF